MVLGCAFMMVSESMSRLVDFSFLVVSPPTPSHSLLIDAINFQIPSFSWRWSTCLTTMSHHGSTPEYKQLLQGHWSLSAHVWTISEGLTFHHTCTLHENVIVISSYFVL